MEHKKQKSHIRQKYWTAVENAQGETLRTLSVAVAQLKRSNWKICQS